MRVAVGLLKQGGRLFGALNDRLEDYACGNIARRVQRGGDFPGVGGDFIERGGSTCKDAGFQ